MIIDPVLAVTSAATGALGTYNVVRFLVAKGIEKRREIKRQRDTDAKIQKAVEIGEAVLRKIAGDKLSDTDVASARAIAAHVRELIADVKAPSKIVTDTK